LNEEAIEPIAHLDRILPVMVQQQRFIAVAAHQRDLAERLAAARNEASADDPRTKARLRDLEDEQRQGNSGLDDVLQSIRQQVKKLPANDQRLDQLRDSATKFEQAVRASPAKQQIGATLNALSEFDGKTAAEQAAAAATTLEKFIGQCNGMGECAGN